MKKRELKDRLERALSNAAPDDVEGVLSRCEMRKGAVIPMTNKKNTKLVRNLVAACLALTLVGGGGGLWYQQSYAVASVVSLDVNPSIELSVNRKEQVLSCTALNQEAAEVLADMGGGADLEGVKLKVAVNAIVGSLVRYGYLDNISSAILISVEDDNQERAAKLQEELTAAVDGALQEQAANAQVLSQTIEPQPALETQARENNISTGKAYLVRQVMEMNGSIATNSTTALEQTSRLSVEELSDLLEHQIKEIPIGKSVACLEVEKYAGTLSVDSVTAEVDSELDEDRPHYEVELHHPTLGEFEYRVDAFTGEVYQGQADVLLSTQPTLTGEEALELAMRHMGQHHTEHAKHNVLDRSVKLKENGREYEVTFTCNGYDFDYCLDAYTGQVLEWDMSDHHGNLGGGGQISLGVATPYIKAEEAERAALHHAGLTRDQVTGLKTELEKDHGHARYEVEFNSGGMEYEYEIDAGDGAVWNFETGHHH